MTYELSLQDLKEKNIYSLGDRVIRVMLVDDEVLALEYLKGLIDWEAHGFRVEGCAGSAQGTGNV